jgi:DnaJ-class molecular chaperone
MFHPGVQKPEPIVQQIQLSLEQAYHGCNMPIEIERWIISNNVKVFEKETLYISIHAGIDDKEQLTIAEKGNVIGESKGEIKLIIQIINDTHFRRNGLDLIYVKSITLKECLCGFSFEMIHLNGKKLCINNLNNPTVIKPNFNKVIQSMGMVRENSVGNMIINFEIHFPDIITPEQIAILANVL